MTPADRPVADREPLSAEDAKNLREVVESQARLGHPMTIVPNDVLLRLLATLDAARAHPDEAGLREDVGYLADAAQHLADHVTEAKFYCEDTDNVQHFVAKVRAALAQPAVPVAGAEDWYDRDAKAFARAHAQTGALRAAQPEDDGLDANVLARALAAWFEPIRVAAGDHTLRLDPFAAADIIAAEYARLSAERRDGA